MRQNGSKSSRIKTRYPGIFYRETDSGRRRYSCVYRDSSGRQHWKTVDGGLDDAKTAQAALAVRKGRGERIEPTRLTFEQAATRWLDAKTRLRTRTRIGYEGALRNHLLPAFGPMKVHAISEDDIARFVRELEAKGLQPWTIRGQLTPLSGIFQFSIRRGWRSDNPIRNLAADEKPEIGSRQKRILETGDIQKLLAAMPEKYRPIFQTAVFTGARIGEVLGLRWGDVDFNRQVIRVRRQLTQLGEIDEPKTASGKREILMFPNLATMLREHRLRSPFSKDGDYVFTTRRGTPFSQRNVTKRGLEKAADAVGLNRPGERIHSHDLRHTFASMLIREGADVVFVARQLGHANPAITLRVYAHLFDSEAQSTKMRDALEVRFGGNAVVTSNGERGEKTGKVAAANVVSMRAQGSRS